MHTLYENLIAKLYSALKKNKINCNIINGNVTKIICFFKIFNISNMESINNTKLLLGVLE